MRLGRVVAVLALAGLAAPFGMHATASATPGNSLDAVTVSTPSCANGTTGKVDVGVTLDGTTVFVSASSPGKGISGNITSLGDGTHVHQLDFEPATFGVVLPDHTPVTVEVILGPGPFSSTYGKITITFDCTTGELWQTIDSLTVQNATCAADNTGMVRVGFTLSGADAWATVVSPGISVYRNVGAKFGAGSHTDDFVYYPTDLDGTVPDHSPVTVTVRLGFTLGSSEYGQKSITFDCTTGKLWQDISFLKMGDRALTDDAPELRATASSGLGVTFSSNTTSVCTVTDTTITMLHVGTCTIKASQAGDATYAAAADALQSFEIDRGSQTILFPAIPGKLYGVKPFTISATATSGLSVTFTSLNPKFCGVSGTTVTVKAPGGCTIRANQSGDTDYFPAPPMNRTFVTGLVVRNLTPVANATVIRGQNTAVGFQLAGAGNKPIPDALASSLVGGCKVRVSIANGPVVCGVYDAGADTFSVSLPISAGLAKNTTYQLAVRVVAPAVAVAKIAQPVRTDSGTTCIASPVIVGPNC